MTGDPPSRGRFHDRERPLPLRHSHDIGLLAEDRVAERLVLDAQRPALDDPELTVLNPGSLSFPRQEGRRPSYALMEYGESGKARFEIRYL